MKLQLMLGGIAAIAFSGCNNITHPKQYFLYAPRPLELANPSLDKEGTMPGALEIPTDEHVLVFVHQLTNVYRGKMNVAMGVRHFSSFAQVLTAAAAATLTTLRPEERMTITLLAASSALMPQFQAIFDAKGRATAYEQGAAMLSDAEAAYFKIRAASPRSFANSQRQMTPEGALLYGAALASIQVVEKLAVSQLPTQDQIKAAKGEFIAELTNDLTPRAETARAIEIWMKDENTESVTSLSVSGIDSSSVAFSSAPDFVSVVAKKNAVELRAHKPGHADITAVVSEGGAKRILHTDAIVPIELKQTRFNVARGSTVTLDAGSQKIATVTPKTAGIVSVAPAAAALTAAPQSTATVTGTTVGTTLLIVAGEHGGEAVVTVTVH